MAKFKHFFLNNTSISENYAATGGGSGPFRSLPRDSREDHGKKLFKQWESAKITAAAREGAAEPNVAGVSFVTLLVDGFVGELNGKQQSGLDLEKVRR